MDKKWLVLIGVGVLVLAVGLYYYSSFVGFSPSVAGKLQVKGNLLDCGSSVHLSSYEVCDDTISDFEPRELFRYENMSCYDTAYFTLEDECTGLVEEAIESLQNDCRKESVQKCVNSLQTQIARISCDRSKCDNSDGCIKRTGDVACDYEELYPMEHSFTSYYHNSSNLCDFVCYLDVPNGGGSTGSSSVGCSFCKGQDEVGVR